MHIHAALHDLVIDCIARHGNGSDLSRFQEKDVRVSFCRVDRRKARCKLHGAFGTLVRNCRLTLVLDKPVPDIMFDIFPRLIQDLIGEFHEIVIDIF